MKKRGQFYLVTSILLIGIFLSVITIKNEFKKPRDILEEAYIKQLNLEKSKLLDYAAYNQLSENQINQLFDKFASNYTQYLNGAEDALFIYGNNSEVSIKGYITENNVFYYDNLTIHKIAGSNIFIKTPIVNSISILINDDRYEFDFSTGQNIYYIIRHKYSNEVHIFSG